MYKRITVYQSVVAGSATEANYKDSLGVYNTLITGFNPLTINTRGYELIKAIQEFGDEESKGFVVSATQVYSRQLDLNKMNTEIIKNDVEGTLLEWRNEKLWFSDFMQGNLTKSYIDYVLNDPIYKNKVVYHSLLMYNNYARQLMTFQEEMKQLLKEAEKFK